jgi:hypothetical protein
MMRKENYKVECVVKLVFVLYLHMGIDRGRFMTFSIEGDGLS